MVAILLQAKGEPLAHPGWFVIDGKAEGEDKGYSVVRKQDGTWWYIAVHHIFPSSGENLRLELGDQIKDEQAVEQYEKYYTELKTAPAIKSQ